MGWNTGTRIAEDIWREIKPLLNEEQQKKVSDIMYNEFCNYDADNWNYSEGKLMYDAYKLNGWKLEDEE